MNSKFIILLLIFHLSPALAFKVDLDVNKWKHVNYSKITPNKITNTNNSLEITINNSSSALVFSFDHPVLIKNLKLKARMKGSINYHDLTPGDEGADDFPLRIGLILKGENTLNFFQKSLAPNWLIELDKLATEKGGLDKIHSLVFYTNRPSFQSREHPLSSYFFEEVTGSFTNSLLELTTSPNIKKEAIGIWMSADGDDTKSSFKVTIDNIEITKKNK